MQICSYGGENSQRVYKYTPVEVEEKRAKGTMSAKRDADLRLFAYNKYYENFKKKKPG